MQLLRSIRIISIILLIVSLLSGCASVQAPSTGVTGRVPLAGSQSPGSWNFAVLCDTRGDSNPENLDKSGVNEVVVASVARDIVKAGAKLVIVPGDMVNGSYAIRTPYARQFATWRKAMDPVYAAGIKVYPVRGNHEDGPFVNNEKYPWPPTEKNNPAVISIPELKAAFLEAFNDPWIPANGPDGEKGLTYSFGYNNAFFIGLDEFVNPIKVNQAWLDNELMSNTRAHVFVYGHDPAFRVTHTDSLASYPLARDAFWDSLGKAGVKIYFCGHDHYYNRAHVKDRAGNIIYQVLPGSGGAPFSKWQPQQYAEGSKVVNDYHDEVHYGYVLVTIDDTKVIRDTLEYSLK
jgi:hypothetical protein